MLDLLGRTLLPSRLSKYKNPYPKQPELIENTEIDPLCRVISVRVYILFKKA